MTRVWPAKQSHSAFKSAASARIIRNRESLRWDARYSSRPLDRLSNTVTASTSGLASNESTKWLPMNPAPPTTATRRSFHRPACSFPVIADRSLQFTNPASESDRLLIARDSRAQALFGARPLLQREADSVLNSQLLPSSRRGIQRSCTLPAFPA